jgi:hypothetical protein
VARSFVSIFAFASISFFAVGCATLFSDSYDNLTINSEPEGADVYWRGERIGRTPFTYQFKRQTAASYLEFAKRGYEDKKVSLNRTVAPVAWLNLGFLTVGTSSWGTDVSSGAMWEYKPKSYVAKLTASGREETWNENVMEFVIANESSLKKELARGSGESLKSLCSMLRKTPEKCQTFSTRAKQEKTLSSPNALEFYRALRAVDINLKEDNL